MCVTGAICQPCPAYHGFLQPASLSPPNSADVSNVRLLFLSATRKGSYAITRRDHRGYHFHRSAFPSLVGTNNRRTTRSDCALPCGSLDSAPVTLSPSSAPPRPPVAHSHLLLSLPVTRFRRFIDTTYDSIFPALRRIHASIPETRL